MLCEAFAFGAPVAASGIGAFEEFVEARGLRSLFRPRHPSELMSTVPGLWSDQGSLARMSVSGNGAANLLKQFIRKRSATVPSVSACTRKLQNRLEQACKLDLKVDPLTHGCAHGLQRATPSTFVLLSVNGRALEKDKAKRMMQELLFGTLRNLVCGSLAVALMISGRVRRAKNRVLNSNAVTAIYFHNPNKRLYTRCVRWLYKNGYTFISADQLINIVKDHVEPPRGAVWLSFDDGFQDLLENVVPLSQERKVPITIFIPSGIVEGDGLFPWLSNGQNRAGVRHAMRPADLARIARYEEVTIGSHTDGHIVTANLAEDQARFEFSESKRALESWQGRPVQTFAYPEGQLNGHEDRLLAECGYLLAATTEPALVTRQSAPYFVPRFHVGDNISFAEAICNMVGVWRPAIDPVLRFNVQIRKLIHGIRLKSRVTRQLRCNAGSGRGKNPGPYSTAHKHRFF